MSFQFDFAEVEKLPKLSKEASRALREAYDKDNGMILTLFRCCQLKLMNRGDLSEVIRNNNLLSHIRKKVREPDFRD